MAGDCGQGITFIADMFYLLQPYDFEGYQHLTAGLVRIRNPTINFAKNLESEHLVLAFGRLPSKAR